MRRYTTRPPPAETKAWVPSFAAADSTELDHEQPDWQASIAKAGFGPKRERKGDGKGGLVSDKIKKQRLKMLEKEFGTPSAADEKKRVAEIQRRRKEMMRSTHVPGTIDEKGRLVVAGPKKRATLRWAQGLLALAAVGGSIGGAFVSFAASFANT